MKSKQLQKILDDHKLWIQNSGGERADLQRADLRLANLRWADLQRADLRLANLRWADLQEANLRWADLQRADLQGADLREADLRGADLRLANLQEANLRGADLQEANLQEANLDFSCWPLWCGSKGVKVDRRLYLQLLAYLCAVDVDDNECKAHQQASLDLAKQAHIAKELGLVSARKKERSE